MKRIFSYLSALCTVSSFGLFAYILFKVLDEYIFEQFNMSEEDIEILRTLGDPTWEIYLLSYFLFVFLLVDAVIMTVAAVRNGGSAASASLVMAVPTFISFALIAVNVLDANKYRYDEKFFYISLGLFAASHLIFLIFVLLSKRRNKTNAPGNT